MRVLGIESSCDETAVAIYDENNGLLAHQLYSQVKQHQQYGGVVPELASRDHIRKITPLVRAAMQEAQSTPADIDAVAYTAGPGLIGALLVGACFARGLAWGWGVPSVAVNHIEAHVLAAFLEENKPQWPFLALLVSGGHTQFIQVDALGRYQCLGETLDDAAGEAFDKTAKLLGLPYPGGPELAKIAEQGDPQAFKFTRPMVNRAGLDFSFSGLKTQVATAWRQSDQSMQTRADIAASFQETIVNTFIIKCKRALLDTKVKGLVVAGGVGANVALRAALLKLGEQMDVAVHFPRISFCTDNAAMIAFAGFLRLQQKLSVADALAVKVYPRWPFHQS